MQAGTDLKQACEVILALETNFSSSFVAKLTSENSCNTSSRVSLGPTRTRNETHSEPQVPTFSNRFYEKTVHVKIKSNDKHTSMTSDILDFRKYRRTNNPLIEFSKMSAVYNFSSS